MGSAKIISGDLSLTRADEWVAGACWYHQKVEVQYGFETEFQFMMDQHGGWQGKGADGLAFVISNDQKGFTVGELGEGMGYQGITNCLVVEFDSFDNQEGGDNHISIHNNGRNRVNRYNNHSLAINHKIPELQNTVRKAKITYDFKYIRVYIDGTLYLKKEVHLEKKMKLDEGKAYIGFTAATAGAYFRHRILNWKWKREKKILARIQPLDSDSDIVIHDGIKNPNKSRYLHYAYYQCCFYPLSLPKMVILHYDSEAVMRRRGNYIVSKLRRNIINT